MIVAEKLFKGCYGGDGDDIFGIFLVLRMLAPAPGVEGPSFEVDGLFSYKVSNKLLILGG